MNNTVIEYSNHIKYLGITLDTKLTFGINNACVKAAKTHIRKLQIIQNKWLKITCYLPRRWNK